MSSSNGDDRARVVHEARKTIKRMRALARLLRREIGEPEFRRVNASLREAGRRLAGARDAEVRFATLSDLRAHHPSELAGKQTDALLARLREQRDAQAWRASRQERAGLDEPAGPNKPAAQRKRDGQDEPTARDKAACPEEPAVQRKRHGQDGHEGQSGNGNGERAVLADIASMRRELLRWNLLEHDRKALIEGLRAIYRDGRRRYRRVRHAGAHDHERMHDWRKRVKSLYYALDMLGGRRRPGTASLARRADLLGETLGAEHDLWMLASFLRQDPLLDGDTSEMLLGLIERRRRRLQQLALRQGAELYRRKPSRFAKRAGRALAR